MSIFKKSTIFWYLEYLLSLMFVVWAFKIVMRKGATGLIQIYETELSEFVMLAIILPIFVGLVLKKVSDYMNYSKILNMGSRCKWQSGLVKELINICVKYTIILLAPMSFASFAFSKNFRTWQEITYFLLCCVMYTAILLVFALIIIVIKVQWNTDVIALLSVIVIAFVPYVFSNLLIRKESLTFSNILNALFVFNNGRYLWVLHIFACAVTLLLVVLVNRIIKWDISRKDLLWRQNEN